MKAIVRATGEIVDVYERYDDLAMETVFEELAGSYRPDELDFSVGEKKEAEGAVISGWVARDADETISLFDAKPERVRYRRNNEGLWMGKTMTDLDSELFPDLTWESKPLEVEITIKPKRK